MEDAIPETIEQTPGMVKIGWGPRREWNLLPTLWPRQGAGNEVPEDTFDLQHQLNTIGQQDDEIGPIPSALALEVHNIPRPR